jgi:hypothetical protein
MSLSVLVSRKQLQAFDILYDFTSHSVPSYVCDGRPPVMSICLRRRVQTFHEHFPPESGQRTTPRQCQGEDLLKSRKESAYMYRQLPPARTKGSRLPLCGASCPLPTATLTSTNKSGVTLSIFHHRKRCYDLLPGTVVVVTDAECAPPCCCYFVKTFVFGTK